MHIRPATLSDCDEMARLCGELGYDVTPIEMKQRLSVLMSTDEQFIAVADGERSQLMGWIGAQRRLLLESGERIEIIGLIVDKNARRKGIGRLLVSAGGKWADKAGVETIVVRSNIARDAAHRFYSGIGFTRQKTQHMYARRHQTTRRESS